MLKSATWLKLAKKHEMLCGECTLIRAEDRNIDLTFADLEPCPFNILFGRPISWFSYVLPLDESDDTLVSREWKEEIVLAMHVSEAYAEDRIRSDSDETSSTEG
jgi:hypothetical protein